MWDVVLGGGGLQAFSLSQKTAVGVPVAELQSLARRARKRHSDDLHLSVKELELNARVERGYDNHNVVSQGTMDLIDADAIRDEPDLPDIDRDIHVTVDADPFMDALSYAVGASKHVTIDSKGVNQHTNALYIGGETATRHESVAIDGVDPGATGESTYSTDYIKRILSGISETDPADVTLSFDNEFPITFEMERDDVPMQVTYMTAPRIQSE